METNGTHEHTEAAQNLFTAYQCWRRGEPLPELDYGMFEYHITALKNGTNPDFVWGQHVVKLALDTQRGRPSAPVPQTAIIPDLPASARPPDGASTGACRWLDDYIAFSRHWSPQSYDGFHEACGLWLLSTVAARRVVLHFGGERYTNLYIALCSRSSVFAKTTAAKIATQALQKAMLSYLLAPDESTPQAYVHSLTARTPTDYNELSDERLAILHKRLAFAAQKGWYYDEFGQKITAMMREGGFMADFRGLLRQLDNTPDVYEYATIGRGNDYVERPYLALLAALTPADLQPFAKRGAALWSDGFFARFAFVTPPADAPSTEERFPRGVREIPDALIRPVVHWHLRLGVPRVTIEESVDANGKPTGGYQVTVTPVTALTCHMENAVEDAFYAYHNGLRRLVTESENTDLDSSYTRFAEKALRIAMLLSSLENDGRIELRHWWRGQEITERWRRDLHHLISQVTQSVEVAEERSLEHSIHQLLSQSETNCLTTRDIYRTLHRRASDVRPLLEEMERNGIVKRQVHHGSGRPQETWSL